MKSLILTVANLAAYAVAAMALFALSPDANFSLPWWVALSAPAVVYTFVVVMFCPRASTAEAIGIVTLLFIAHAALASATGVVYAAFTAQSYPAAFAIAAWEYLPAPILQLLCVSLLVLPFRALYAPRRGRRRGRLAASAAGAVSANGSARPIRAASELPSSPRTVPDVPSPAAPALAAPGPEGFGGGPASHSTGVPAPIAGGSRRDGAERVEEVVSIPFDRIADQLPAGAFTLPPERLGANLLEPGHLLVPTRLVVPQLADGYVTVAWEEVADQFPRHALAVNEATVRDGLAEGRLVLPLDEVVRRLPPELFASTLPSADVEGLERFPLPFRPLEPDPVLPEVSPPLPSPAMDVAPAPAADVVEAEPVPNPSAEPTQVADEISPAAVVEYIPPFLTTEHEIEYGLGASVTEPEAVQTPEPLLMPPAETPPVAAPAPQVETPTIEVPRLETPPVQSPEPLLMPPAETPPAAAPSPRVEPPPVEVPRLETPPVEVARDEVPRVDRPRIEDPRVAPARVERPVADVPGPVPPSTADRARQASHLAAVLTPFGALEVGSTGIEGVTLFTFASGALPGEAVLRTAASTLPFLMTGRAPWTVDQLTVRRAGGAIIITPLGSIESGGPAMVASVGRVGSLALLEIVCLKAARDHRVTYPTIPARREPAATGPGATHYETRNAGGLSLGFLAGDLDAFGRVAPTVLRDAAGDNEVCVFLAPGEDSRAVAGFAVDVCRALVLEGDEPALGALQSVTFRLGERRLVVRPVKGTPGRFSVLVAAGDAVVRPGLAHRQLERAAAVLRGA
jgi:hypothetical protein